MNTRIQITYSSEKGTVLEIVDNKGRILAEKKLSNKDKIQLAKALLTSAKI
jgi:hypothetical protein